MEDLTHIEWEIDGLIAEIKAHPQGTEDMRRSYLELTLSGFNSYYLQWLTIQAGGIMRHRKPSLPASATQEEILTLNKFLNTTINDGYHLRTRGSYRSLILDSWSTFEFCVTYVCIHLLDDKAQRDLLDVEFKKIDKIISKYTIEEDDKRKILKAYSKDHLSHLPVTRKYEHIYSLFKKNYTGTWVEDKKFLEFFGKYRNSMHSNFIYHGNDAEYNILGINYRFTDGDPINQSEKSTANNMFDLALELKNICRRLFDAIDYPGLIPFPSEKVPQPQ